MSLPAALRPIPHSTAGQQPVLVDLLHVRRSLIRAHYGRFVPEVLAAAVRDAGRWDECVWLRLGPDGKSGVAGLIGRAMEDRWQRSVADTRVAPGRAQRWAPAPPGAIVVLELQDRLDRGGARTVRRLAARAPSECSMVVVVHAGRVGARLLRCVDRVIGPTDLEYRPARLEHDWQHRLLALCGDRASIVHNVLQASVVWPPGLVGDAVSGARDSDDLMRRVTSSLLDAGPAIVGSTLSSAARSGYVSLGAALSGPVECGLRPWVVPLEGGWAAFSPVWRDSVAAIGPGRVGRPRPTLSWRDGRWRPCAAGVARPEAGAIVADCRMLGAFELFVDGRQVENGSGRVGWSIVRLLLISPSRSAFRDELLEAFWPDVDPRVSRNRLQVAISAARRSFKEVCPSSPLVVYDDGRYRLDPAITFRTDVDRFEAAIRTARQAERGGDRAMAQIHYRRAFDEYRGDFAPDVPYDEWAVLPRERLRLSYLDALDRAVRLCVEDEATDESIDLAQRLVEQDPCREDAHRILMSCYSRQGRDHLVDYQYGFCVRMLETRLGVSPSPATTETHRTLRPDGRR